ncbi:MAG: hypothetical protein KJO04_08485 [Bacteroidia bacterium]|nr:hypothetical protein [Bacteroidia bacterium]
MLKACAIQIAMLILVQGVSFNFGDLVQFDELIEHAKFHKETYGDNFLVFLSKHYGELQSEHSEKHQEEESEHQQLPLNHNSCSHALISPFILNHQLLSDLALDFTPENKNNFYYAFSKSSLFTMGVFEPPRSI